MLRCHMAHGTLARPACDRYRLRKRNSSPPTWAGSFTEHGWSAEIRRTRHIGDFRKDHDSYQQAFDRVGPSTLLGHGFTVGRLGVEAQGKKAVRVALDAVRPDVIACQVDVVPAERGEVRHVRGVDASAAAPERTSTRPR